MATEQETKPAATAAPSDMEALMNGYVMPELNRRLKEAGGEPLTYYYNDISRQEQTDGGGTAYPALFRLLRTETEYKQGRFADRFVFRETFVFGEKADTDPGPGTEQPLEQRILDRVAAFNAVMASVPGVTYTPPATLKWWRRDTANYALLVSFDARIELNTTVC